jgi:hypothetical protein
MAPAGSYGTGNSQTACSETKSLSSVQLKMTGEEPESLS